MLSLSNHAYFRLFGSVDSMIRQTQPFWYIIFVLKSWTWTKVMVQPHVKSITNPFCAVSKDMYSVLSLPENNKKQVKRKSLSASSQWSCSTQNLLYAICINVRSQCKNWERKRVFSLVVLSCHGAAHHTSVNLGFLAGLNRIMHFKHFFNE